MEGKRQGDLDLFSFFMFEASGDSGADSSDDPNTELGSHYRYYYDCYNESTRGEVEDDAESCVIGSSNALPSSLSVNLHDLDDNEGEGLKDDEEVSRAVTDDDGRGHDLWAIISTARDHHHLHHDQDICNARDHHHHHHDQEKSCLSDESISEDFHRRRRDQEKCVPDNSISEDNLHHPYCKLLTEKEKDKLFWEACLAS